MPGRRRFGPWFALEVAFILAVAVVLLLAEVSWPAIVAGIAVAWLIVAAVEVALARRSERRTPEPAAAEETAAAVAEPEHPPEPEPEPQPEPRPVSEDEPRPELDGEPAELPPPPPPPALAAVPEPPPVEREPEPEPEEEPRVVELQPRAPREWNLWELERIAREHAGADPARDEERSFVLMSLREFASPDGALPADFDGVVRESFGDLLAGGR